jgi:PAS domain S-box-containing protein
LKFPDTTGPIRFGLGTQSLLIVSFILLLELCFVGGLNYLLEQTEHEALRLEHARAMIDGSNRLAEQIFTLGRSGSRFITDNDPEALIECKKARREISRLMQWLKDELKDSPQQLALLDDVDTDLQEALSVADASLALAENGPPGLALTRMSSKLDKLRKLSDRVNQRVVTFVNEQRKIEMESPRAQRIGRSRIKALLIIAVALNIILAIALALFFIGNVINRINLVVANANRLTIGLPLNPVLGGKDEIARLDYVFHEMADNLQRESDLLRASEARVRNIIERMPVGLLILNLDGKIEFSNSHVAEILGYGAQELKSMPINRLFKTRPSQPLESFYEDLRSRSTGKVTEMTALSKSGQELQIEFSLGELSTSEGVRDLATILDVTERYEIQKLRQAFVSMVSHELRTPLTSVKGYLSLIDMGAFGQVTKELKDGAAAGERNVGRLINLINELLDLEKLESGKMDIKKTEVFIGDLFEQSLDAVRVFAQEKAVTLKTEDLTTNLISADPARIVQVLINLLSNAIKFSSAGSFVKMTAQQNDQCFEISIKDEGAGIPREYRESIFERFQQVDAAGTNRREGTGLGLAICKAIIEQHGGEIGVESELQRGSRFWFRLPRNA